MLLRLELREELQHHRTLPVLPQPWLASVQKAVAHWSALLELVELLPAPVLPAYLALPALAQSLALAKATQSSPTRNPTQIAAVQEVKPQLIAMHSQPARLAWGTPVVLIVEVLLNAAELLLSEKLPVVVLLVAAK